MQRYRLWAYSWMDYWEKSARRGSSPECVHSGLFSLSEKHSQQQIPELHGDAPIRAFFLEVRNVKDSIDIHPLRLAYIAAPAKGGWLGCYNVNGRYRDHPSSKVKAEKIYV
jgi:hypothetical protein